jgi:hypothetical protein
MLLSLIYVKGGESDPFSLFIYLFAKTARFMDSHINILTKRHLSQRTNRMGSEKTRY